MLRDNLVLKPTFPLHEGKLIESWDNLVGFDPHSDLPGHFAMGKWLYMGMGNRVKFVSDGRKMIKVKVKTFHMV